MAQLIVTPIDRTAPGSHKQIKEMIRAFGALQSGASKNPAEMLAAYEKLETLLLPHLASDNGVEPLALFDDISEDRYGELLQGLIGAPSVPEVNGVS